jgi:hypothetical protein
LDVVLLLGENFDAHFDLCLITHLVLGGQFHFVFARRRREK